MVRSRWTNIFDNVSIHVVLAIFGIIALYPVLYTLMTSFKTQDAVLTDPPTFFPPEWVFESYQILLNHDMVRHYIPNTFINSMSSSLLVVTIASLAAYTFSRYRFRGSRFLELFILALMMIPGLTFLIPYYRIASELDLLNTHTFIVAVYVAWGVPFAIWIIRSFMDAIPYELEEAALIDGASPVQALRYIVLPLALPGLLAAFLLVFVDTWNEFLIALVLLTGDARTATVGLNDFSSSFEIAYHVWTAACILIMTPVLIVFLALRRTFFNAMLQGAVKG